ncbi:trypsin-1-like isoform X1 [Daphnia pulex]|uniref:trypsin-1-like isoform X1 n=1 Tax=Daphnia pulex TaxID=6669 RepID=UPI001EDFCBDD|nr:trypsin-1-like isoform X1 [Daphnia pulex]
MTASILFLLALVAMMCCSCPVSGLVYQTRDAIIMEDENMGGDDEYYQSTNLPSNTFMLKERSCFTNEGSIGTCTSLRSCYPTIKLSQVNQEEMWVMFTRGTCSYGGENGKQMYGVCCPKQSSGVRNSYMSTNPYTRPTNIYSWLQNPYRPTKPVTTMTNGLAEQSADKQSTCGAGPTKTLSFDEQRIVGGTDAQKNSWPSIVSLRLNGQFFCGGSLLSDNQILTAAHCVDRLTKETIPQLTVDFGMHRLNPNDAHVTKKVRRLTIHKDWDDKTNANDIAIITLSSPVTYTSTISPVCLANSNDQFADQEAAIIGWGTTSEGGSLSSVLQQATVKVTTNAQCKTSYSTLATSMLCAAAPGKDTCQGDSGGPLLVRSAPGSPWTQAGIVSFGNGCARPGFPGVYTRVSSYGMWIWKHSLF